MDKLTIKQFAVKVNRTGARISQLIKNGTITADKIGDIYLIDPKYVAIINSRPENRGKKRKAEVTA